MCLVLAAAAALLLGGCGEPARLPAAAGIGAHPVLPPPDTSLVPTIQVADAEGWPAGQAPRAAEGASVLPFARGLAHPRWLAVLPNGDVLVAETNAPPKPEDGKGLKGWFMRQFMKRAGAGVPSPNRITLLRDADGDGVAETRSVFIDGLQSPFGMALVGSQLYVADTDALLRFPYTPGATRLERSAGVKVTDLPAGPINHHWTKNVIASADGSRLYVTVGSNSNVGERGMEQEEGRAAIWEVDAKTGRHRVYASGLRNPNGMGWEPSSHALWTVANERDELGSDLVPDYLTEVRDGGFYGWPYSYWGQHLDLRPKPQRLDLVRGAIEPDYGLGAHTASLGLAFARGAKLPAPLDREGAFIGQHGSWNRSPPAGYKVVFVPFVDGRPAGMPVEVLTGFLSADGRSAYGRPVGVAIDGRGALLVADDVGNTVWRVFATGVATTRP